MLPVIWNLAVIILLIRRVDNKAMLVEPPHRSSLWRYDKTSPVNTKDDMLNCGGYEVQWEQNGGMCGVCGQPFDGLYLDGTEYTIVRSYNQGAYVNVTVEVKSNLLGYFEFRLCPRNNSLETLTHDCFERNMLWIEESWSTRYYVGSHGGIYDLHVRLPADTACSHCVFQWKYSTGYRMGGINECQCMGCGRQETFFNCADIEIITDNSQNQRSFVSTEINIHKPLFLISGENLTDSDIQAFLENMPVFESPRIPEIRKHDRSPSSRKLTYLDRILLGQSTKKQFQTFTRDSLVDVKVKPAQFNWTKASSDTLNWQTDSPYVMFKANISFPFRINQNTNIKKDEVKRMTFWEKISRKPKPSTFWDTVMRNPKPTTFWDKISQQTVPKLFVKSKTIKTGRHNQPRYVPLRSSNLFYYKSLPVGDSITYPLFPVSRHATSVRNGDCHSNSPSYRCKGVGQYANTRGIDQWCISNCRSNHCVKFMCECGCDDSVQPETKCHAVGAFEDIHGMDEWCSQICSQKSCPSNVCSVKDCQNGS